MAASDPRLFHGGYSTLLNLRGMEFTLAQSLQCYVYPSPPGHMQKSNSKNSDANLLLRLRCVARTSIK